MRTRPPSGLIAVVKVLATPRNPRTREIGGLFGVFAKERRVLIGYTLVPHSLSDGYGGWRSQWP
jgi:hypothetical protein